MTECTQQGFAFEGHFSRRVAAEFSGDRLSTETMRANQLRREDVENHFEGELSKR